MPPAHAPGDGQANFVKAPVFIGGVAQKAYSQCFDLQHSDDSFVVALQDENTEALLEGHDQALAYFGECREPSPGRV